MKLRPFYFIFLLSILKITYADTECAVCVILVTLVENYSTHKGGLGGRDSLSGVCHTLLDSLHTLLPTDGSNLIDTACGLLNLEFGKFFENVLPAGSDFNPDDLCAEVPYCMGHNNDGQCRLFTNGYMTNSKKVLATNSASKSNNLVKLDPEALTRTIDLGKEIYRTILSSNIPNYKGSDFKDLPTIMQNLKVDPEFDYKYDNALPIEDLDEDRYASNRRYAPRGPHWRGVDCDESLVIGAHGNTSYPGRDPSHADWDHRRDSNCNGISGAYRDDFLRQKFYEEEYCTTRNTQGCCVKNACVTAVCFFETFCVMR